MDTDPTQLTIAGAPESDAPHAGRADAVVMPLRLPCRPHRRGTVLFVANFSPDVGFAWWLMENFWIQFASVARARGFDPLIMYPTEGPIPSSIRDVGLETAIHAFPGRGVVELLRSLRMLRQRRVRCVYFTDREFSSFKFLLFRLAGVRLILNHDHTPGDRPPTGGLKGLAKAAWRRMPFINCDLQLCVSGLIRERAINHARIPKQKAIVVQNGIDPVHCEEDRDYARRTFSIPRDARVCVTVGRAHWYKRLDFVVEVARRCTLEMGATNLYFICCGDGPDLERLKGLAGASGLGNQFIFAGRRSDVAQILCSADLALHAAKGEAFSLAILEYMSAGLAVLVPDVPTVRQAIRDGENGRVFRDGDADHAARMLMELYHRPEVAQRLGAVAASDVRQRFSRSRMNDAFRATVDAAIANV